MVSAVSCSKWPDWENGVAGSLNWQSLGHALSKFHLSALGPSTATAVPQGQSPAIVNATASFPPLLLLQLLINQSKVNRIWLSFLQYLQGHSEITPGYCLQSTIVIMGYLMSAAMHAYGRTRGQPAVQMALNYRGCYSGYFGFFGLKLVPSMHQGACPT